MNVLTRLREYAVRNVTVAHQEKRLRHTGNAYCSSVYERGTFSNE